MKKVLEKFYKKFDFLIGGHVSDVRVYFEINEGWYNLVWDLCKDLKKLKFEGKVVQIKEKFGGLRFYITSGPDDVYNRISEAEDKSYYICETCGKPGKLRKESWCKTLCDKHYTNK